MSLYVIYFPVDVLPIHNAASLKSFIPESCLSLYFESSLNTSHFPPTWATCYIRIDVIKTTENDEIKL